MGTQIFPDPFYNRFLCKGERIGVTSDGRFDILPAESFCNRLKRFLTFQQDSKIDRVHTLFKTILEQAEQVEGSYFPALADEIHRYGRAKYNYLEANLIYLRKKLDGIGQLNSISKLILKVINAVFTLFGYACIQIKTYAKHYEEGHIPLIKRSFNFHWTSGNYVNPLEREGLKLTATDESTCMFSSDSSVVKKAVQELEKGLEDYYFIKQTHKDFSCSGMSMEQIFANLEISFDPEQHNFLVAINNPEARRIYNPFNDLYHNPRIGPEKIAPVFARHLCELPDKAKTFRYFIEATNPRGIVTQHELIWIVGTTTQQAPFQLNRGSKPIILEPYAQYKFFDESHQEVGSFKIIHNNSRSLRF